MCKPPSTGSYKLGLSFLHSLATVIVAEELYVPPAAGGGSGSRRLCLMQKLHVS